MQYLFTVSVERPDKTRAGKARTVHTVTKQKIDNCEVRSPLPLGRGEFTRQSWRFYRINSNLFLDAYEESTREATRHKFVRIGRGGGFLAEKALSSRRMCL
jgi:hypothetical protein